MRCSDTALEWELEQQLLLTVGHEEKLPFYF